jgi:nucleotide-binding universal stress UspA family protein
VTPIGLIVAAVEDSAHGEAAARTAARYATLLGADLHAIHVVDLPHAVYTLFEAVPLDWDTVAASERESVWKRINTVFGEAGVDATVVDRSGSAAEEIVAYADEVGADLVVIGTRRRGELRRLFLGSTGSRVIQLSGCDVLIAEASEHD